MRVYLFLMVSMIVTGIFCQSSNNQTNSTVKSTTTMSSMNHMGMSSSINTTNIPSVGQIINATQQVVELINPQAKSILNGIIDDVTKKIGNSTLQNITNSSGTFNITGQVVNKINNSTINTNINANITKINNSTSSNPNNTTSINNNNTINNKNNTTVNNNTNINNNNNININNNNLNKTINTTVNNTNTISNTTNIGNSNNTNSNNTITNSTNIINNNTLNITTSNNNTTITTNSTTLVINTNTTSNSSSSNNQNNNTINSNSTTVNDSNTILDFQFDNLDKWNTFYLDPINSDIQVKQNISTFNVSDIYNLRRIVSSSDPQFFTQSPQANNQTAQNITQLNNTQTTNETIKFSAFQLKASYEQWKSIHKKIYGSSFEETFRRAIFFDNYKLVALHNANKSNTYNLSLNAFSDLQEEEFVHKYLTPKTFQQQIHDQHSQDDFDVAFSNEDNNIYDILLPSSTRYQLHNSSGIYMNYTTSNITSQKFKVLFQDLPAEFNWKTKGAVTPVKNQGVCGSCWAFSTTGMIEGVNFLRTNKLTSFSAQQLLDCCGVKGHKCDGCQGAWPDQAISYIKHYGLLKQSQYPYTGVEGACAVDIPTDGVYIESQKYIASNTRSLKKAVVTQPVSVAVDASNWRQYSSGVFDNCVPYKYATNHAALLVGYTSEGHWIVKNSWGTSWGQNGYITLKGGNTCGIQNYALVAKI